MVGRPTNSSRVPDSVIYFMVGRPTNSGRVPDSVIFRWSADRLIAVGFPTLVPFDGRVPDSGFYSMVGNPTQESSSRDQQFHSVLWLVVQLPAHHYRAVSAQIHVLSMRVRTRGLEFICMLCVRPMRSKMYDSWLHEVKSYLTVGFAYHETWSVT